MKHIPISLCIAVASLTIFVFLTSPASAQSKKAAPKKIESKSKKLTDEQKVELKKAQEILKQLDTYKKGLFTRLLNSSKKTTLEALPGIGSATADRIIAARPLESSAHIVLIKGISLKTYSDIVDTRK